MKFFKLFLLAAGVTALFFSCTKTDTTLGVSVGTLKSSDTTGDCLPVTVHGTYTAGVALDRVDNYIDVWVNIKSIGTYNISTDSVNGMQFSGTGRLGFTGLNRVRLYSSGKPNASGLTTFNIVYNGTSCTVSLIVGGLPPGSFLLKDTSGVDLSTASVFGIYTAGVALGLSDSVVMNVNVTNPGSIFLTSNTIDGITFSGTGNFTSTGIHSITLTGSGIPQLTGNFNFAVVDSTLLDSTKFSLAVVPFGGATSPASYTLGCLFSPAGNYTAGVKLQASDSVLTSVNVTKAGAYSIVTAPVNGVTFSATGIFDTIGVHNVTLKGSGLPAAPGSFTYTAAGDSSVCTFNISYGQGSAVYTLGGTPGYCTGFVLSGVYKSDSAVTSNDNVTLSVNVVTVGSYTITTPTVNGISFTGSGNFVTPGTQLITLTATGTPKSPGSYNFAVPTRAGACTFSVYVLPGVSIFAFGSSPYGACTNFKLNGTYVAGTALTANNTVSAMVTVAFPGKYSITTDTVDGVVFNATGYFATAGTQQVTLYGSGMLASATATSYTFTIKGGFNINGSGNTCSFTATLPGSGSSSGSTAAFTLGGSPGSCTGFTLGGIYTSGIALTSSNTVAIQVTVTTIGSYTISTNTVNGIKFSVTGSFTKTGAQTVTLTGSGTPAATGSNTYTVTVGTNSCTFAVNPLPGAAPAAFSLNNSAGQCSGFTPNGTYTTGTALTSANTVVTQVTVTSIGSYSITTPVVNGISFSSSSTFTATGVQPVTLMGTGTPTIAGSPSFAATGGGSTCSFNIGIVAGTTPACASLNTFTLAGYTLSGSLIPFINPINSAYELQSVTGTVESLKIDFASGNVPAVGTYNIGPAVSISYTDPNFISDILTWNATSGQITVSVDINSGNLSVVFCGVKFTGTSVLGGGSKAGTGNGNFQVSP